VRQILVTVDTKLPPAESRINWEEGAYLVADLRHEPPVHATKWKRLRVSQALVIDLAPTGEPVLIEVRQPWETWQNQPLAVPQVQATGSGRILTAGRIFLPLTIYSDPDRGAVHLSLGVGKPDAVVRVASGLAFDLSGVAYEGTRIVTGHLVGLWMFDLPRFSATASLLRALRVVGPPVGGAGQHGTWKARGVDLRVALKPGPFSLSGRL